ncbi:PspC domain-containing protein [Clostridium sp. DL1XJH146]
MNNIKLYKSTTDKKLAGVCGGLAEVLNVDPSIIRIIWALVSFFYGIGIVLYIIAALVLPEGKADGYKRTNNTSNYNNNNSSQNNPTYEKKESQTAQNVNYKEVNSFDDIEQ